MNTLLHRRDKISRPITRINLQYTKSGIDFNEGVAYNAALGSGLSVETEQLTVNEPVFIYRILWNVPAADTYTIRFVTGGTTTTARYTVIASQVVGAGGETTFNPDAGEFLLVPDTTYFLQIDGGSNQKWRYNNSASSYSGTYINLQALWCGTSSYKYVAAVKLLGRPAKLSCGIKTILNKYDFMQ